MHINQWHSFAGPPHHANASKQYTILHVALTIDLLQYAFYFIFQTKGGLHSMRGKIVNNFMNTIKDLFGYKFPYNHACILFPFF